MLRLTKKYAKPSNVLVASEHLVFLEIIATVHSLYTVYSIPDPIINLRNVLYNWQNKMDGMTKKIY